MKLYHLASGPLKVNTYFLVNEKTQDCVIIDSGENYKKIQQTIKENGFNLKAVFLTHAHFDHAGNAKKLQDDGAKIYIGDKDFDKLLNDQNLASDFGRNFDYLTADFKLYDGQEIDIIGIEIKVISTPGHTDGSLTFLVDDMLFTGDTLFLGSVGRTDFVTGDKNAMILSVRKLFALDGDYKVFPGHDEFTTLEHERKYNLLAEYD